MMIGPDWLFVSTPKCGTRTMYNVLPQFGGKRLRSFHARPHSSEHRGITFSICRNPLSRAVSMWWATCMTDGDRYGFRAKSGSDAGGFQAFVEWLTQEGETQLLTSTQAKWHRNTNVDRFLRMESLEAGFHTLPFVEDRIDLPREGATEPLREPWHAYHTPETIHRIAEWAAKDFEQFDYEVPVC